MNRIMQLKQLLDQALASSVNKTSKDGKHEADLFGECPHIKYLKAPCFAWHAKLVHQVGISKGGTVIVKRCDECAATTPEDFDEDFEVVWQIPYFILSEADTRILIQLMGPAKAFTAFTEKGRQIIQSLTS